MYSTVAALYLYIIINIILVVISRDKYYILSVHNKRLSVNAVNV